MIYPPILILETPMFTMFTMFTMFKMPISSMDPPIFWHLPADHAGVVGFQFRKIQTCKTASSVGSCWIPSSTLVGGVTPLKKNGMSSNWLWQTAPNNWLLILNCCLNQRMGLKNYGKPMVLPSFLRFSCHPVQFLQEFLKRSGLYKGRNPFTEWIPRKGMLCVSQFGMFSESGAYIIELDDGKIYRKPLYLIV